MVLVRTFISKSVPSIYECSYSYTQSDWASESGQSSISQRMRAILLFYSPNHCYLSNCSVGSDREFELRGSFPQNRPQSFSQWRSHFCSDDWYLILEQILLILSSSNNQSRIKYFKFTMIAQLVGLVFKAIANTNIDETKAGNQRYAMWHRTSF